MAAEVIRLRPGVADAAAAALEAVERHLDRCSLAENSKRAYRRCCRAYVDWLSGRAGEHGDAFTDEVGADAAVTAWRRALLNDRAAPSTINQALAAVSLMYEQVGLRVKVKRVRQPRPGEPDALTAAQMGAIERAAARSNTRDAAIVAVLEFTGARVEECARLDMEDVAITARTGTVRLHGKGDEVRTVPVPQPAREKISAWLLVRGTGPGALWTGQRGRMTVSGITDVVLKVGRAAGVEGLRPHAFRHTYATRLRQGGADVAQVQALLGHASLETTGRYFRAGDAERAAVVERVFEQ